MKDENSQLEDWLRRYFAPAILVCLAFLLVAWLATEVFFDAIVPGWFGRIERVLPDGVAADVTANFVARLLTVVLTFFGGLFVSAMWLWRNAISNKQANAAQKQAEVANRQAEVALKTQISTDLAKAYEQLDSDKMAVRIGAIYTLEKVMRDVKEADFNLYWSIIETLCGFARERSREFPTAKFLTDATDDEALQKEAKKALAKAGSNLDICSVLTVIGRRGNKEDDKAIDLSGVFAKGFSAPDEALDFSDCGLSEAVLVGAKLQDYCFSGSILDRANLR